MRPEKLGDVVALVREHELPQNCDVGFVILDLDLYRSQSQPGGPVVTVEALQILVVLWFLLKKKEFIKIGKGFVTSAN